MNRLELQPNSNKPNYTRIPKHTYLCRSTSASCGTKLTEFFASAEDAQAWLNSSNELQSIILICHYYPAYDLEKAGRLSRLQMQVLLEGIKFARKLENL